MSDKPTPEPTEDTADFWAACNDGQLIVQECEDCGHRRFYPAEVCPECWSDDWTEIELEGEGTVESHTTVHRPPSSAFEADTPYVVALIDVGGSCTMMANIFDEPEAVSIGDAVQLVWEKRDEQQIPQFELQE